MKKISRRSFFRLVLAGASVTALSACGASQQAAASDSAGSFVTSSLLLSVEEYPRIAGVTAAMPLMAEMLHEIAGLSAEDAKSSVSSTNACSAWEDVGAWYDPAYPEYSSSLLLAYPAPEEAQQEMDSAGITLESTPLTQDALVFFVSEENPVKALTSAQLADIYTGKITNWKDVGGADAPILPRQGDSYSAGQAMFLNMVMKDKTPMAAATESVPCEGGLVEEICSYGNTPSELGFGVYYYLRHMCALPGIRLLKIDDVEPTDKTLKDGSYPLCCSLYAAIRADEAQDSAARKLYSWLLGDEGRQCLQRTEYLPAPQQA
jgi:phosphate transport system substrate-binding protein